MASCAKLVTTRVGCNTVGRTFAALSLRPSVDLGQAAFVIRHFSSTSSGGRDGHGKGSTSTPTPPHKPAANAVKAPANAGTPSVLNNISQAFKAGGSTAAKPARMQAKPAVTAPKSASATSAGSAPKTSSNTSTATIATGKAATAAVASNSKPVVQATASTSSPAANTSMATAVDAFKRMREEFAKLRAMKDRKPAEHESKHTMQAAQQPKAPVGMAAAAARTAGRAGMFGKRISTQMKQPRAHMRRVKAVVVKRTVVISDGLTVKELAKRMGLKVEKLLTKLEDLGEAAADDSASVEPEVAEIIVQEFGHVPKRTDGLRRDRLPTPKPSAEVLSGFKTRPPVVTVMGHVDHGKTTLMDVLRGTSVAEKEAGGITQSVGAFTVDLKLSGEKGSSKLTFLDTPGHALFSSMRQRGISVADIVCLVIDGKDGIMPQTSECLASISEAELPFVIAVTKCDVVDPESALERVGKQLLEAGVATTAYGGDVQMIAISAKTGLGLQELKEALHFQAELSELRADDASLGEAIIIDSKVLKGIGIVIDSVMTWGSLKPGDVVMAGCEYGKVKALLTDASTVSSSSSKKKEAEKKEHTLAEVGRATPGMPVRVLGLKGLPPAGEYLLAVESEERAKSVIEGRMRKMKLAELAQVAAADAVKRAADREAYNQKRQRRVAYETALQRERKRVGLQKAGMPVPPHLAMEPWEVLIMKEGREGRIAGIDASGRKLRQQGGQQQVVQLTHDAAVAAAASDDANPAEIKISSLPMIAKADSSGSLTAIQDAVARISKVATEVIPKVVHASVGELSDKDVQLAADMGANVICFNAKVSQAVQKVAEKRGVEIRSGRVIYHLLDEICDLVASKMTPTIKEETLAIAEVKSVFTLNSKKAEPQRVAGCVITEGTFTKSGVSKYRVMRGDEQVAEVPELASLMHLKDKVESVKKGTECGMMLPGFSEFQAGDKIVAIKEVRQKPKLEVRFG